MTNFVTFPLTGLFYRDISKVMSLDNLKFRLSIRQTKDSTKPDLIQDRAFVLSRQNYSYYDYDITRVYLGMGGLG